MPATRKNSAAAAQQAIRRHIVPVLGKIQLQKLRADQVQSFVNGLVQSGYAPATIRRMMATLRTALQQAVKNQLILRNNAMGIRLPKMEQKEIVVFTADEQRRLLEALPNTDNGRALRFILGTGLRSSEVCGLRWKDIKGNSFTVNQAITTYSDYEVNEGPRVKKQTAPPKSSAGRTNIPLTGSMLTLLEEQRKAQLKDKEAALSKGMGWPGEGLVFTTPAGQAKDRANLPHPPASAGQGKPAAQRHSCLASYLCHQCSAVRHGLSHTFRDHRSFTNCIHLTNLLPWNILICNNHRIQVL